MDRSWNSETIKRLASRHGFTYCGISKAEFLEDAAPKLEQWLKNGFHGEMSYLENHFDKRLDPTVLVPGAKSVISLLYNYCPAEKIPEGNLKIATYAYGDDYHYVIKDKCRELFGDITEEIGEIGGRIFVDSAPVMERAWAERSGLGWIGRHGLLINKQQGSFFFLAELIIDLECEPDGAVKDFCGTCTKCVDACPTEAILPDKVLNAGKCISYLTIELKNEIPSDFKGSYGDWIFGCDICQDVCPWNRFSKPHLEERFKPDFQKIAKGRNEWMEITEEVFQRAFGNSALSRTGIKGLQRNIRFISDH